MSRTMTCLALACLVGGAGAQTRSQEHWQVDSGSGRLAFYPEVLRAIGASADAASRPDADARLGVSFEATGRFDLDAPGSIFRDILGGSLRLSSRGALRGANGRIALDGMELRRGDEERTLAFVGRDGRTWFEADHMHFAADRKLGRFRMFNLDVRLTTEAARVMGDVRYSDLAVAVLELEFPVPELVGAVETPSGACTTPNWGLPNNDVALTAIGSVQQMARDDTPPARIAIAPSATLMNVGQTEVPWYSKFSGVFPPYNNDQHPFLVWNIYRVAGGVIEQLGVSPLKHAFLTINSGCGCSSGNILWVGCADTYGTGTNDSTGSLGPRAEIQAYTGVWQRCQSIFDPDCNGVQNSPPGRANPMDRRMAVLESDMQTAGAIYYMDSWYVVRDDVDIFNTMGWRVVNPVAPTPPSTQWTFGFGTGLTQGAVIDQWVNPAAPGANADSVTIDTRFGRLRLAVRATNLGGGQWHYEYALMNFDFDPAVKSFSIPVPAGAVVTNIGFHDADLNAATDWSGSVGAGALTWSAPTAASAQRFSTLYNFRFDVNASPSAAGGAVATLGVQAARGWQLQPAVLGPGTLTPLSSADHE